ncbi:MAG: Bug family tripartite tricarboxylate transporter substrate binding protein [Xanthobacteraceae bacterium]
MLTRRSLLGTAAASAAVLGLNMGAHAEAEPYPTGPIRAICPFATGSGADAKIRFYMSKLSELCGKPGIVENKAGALGNIATETVARAKPDGYTIYVAPGSSTLAAAPALFKKLGYDPINDFEHITTLSSSAFVLCVAGDSPFKTVSDLTAFLKEKGEGASYASVAPPGLVSSEIYKADFGLKTVEVKYKEIGSMLNDLFSGQVAFTHIDMTTIAGQLKSGKLRALHVTSAKRLHAAPDIPGAEEAGVPNMDVVTWWSVHVPAKTPKPICDKLEEWFNKIAIEPDVVKFNADVGSDVMPGNSQKLRELLAKQTELWREYARIAKIEPQ